MKPNRRSITVYVNVELAEVLRQRAALNNRSVNAEIVYLVECALAEKSETTREFMRLIHKAQGSP